MANQTFNLGYEREWERRRNLQQAALLPLTESGSAKWGELDSYTMIDSDDTAKITALGVEQLKGVKEAIYRLCPCFRSTPITQYPLNKPSCRS